VFAEVLVSTYSRRSADFRSAATQNPTSTHFLPLGATIRDQNSRGQLVSLSRQELGPDSMQIWLSIYKQYIEAIY
jgi:F0F1-type ATP synthase gamma subunit